MTVLSLAGLEWAVDLAWTADTSAGPIARASAQMGLPMCVRTPRATGFGPPDTEDLPSLGAALTALLGGDPWVALVAGDDKDFVLLRSADGAVIPDGEEVFQVRAAATARFAALAGEPGWLAFATPGLAEAEDVRPLDPSSPATVLRDGLRMAPVPRPRGARRAALAAVLALAAAGFAGWEHRDGIRLMVEGPPPPPPEPPEPMVTVAVDGPALIRNCRAALAAAPLRLEGWRVESMLCEAHARSPEMLAAAPELAGRPGLWVTWGAREGRTAPLYRRLAEDLLAGWPRAGVATDGKAWAVAPLAEVLVADPPAPPDDVAFRRSADAGLAQVARLSWQRTAGVLTVTALSDLPLPDIAAAVAAVPGLEVVRLGREGRGHWRLEGRPTAHFEMPTSRLRELAGSSP